MSDASAEAERPWYLRLDPAHGLDLGQALLFYGDPPTAKIYAEVQLMLGFGAPSWHSRDNPPPYTDRHDVEFRQACITFERAEHVLSETLLAKLASGELRGTRLNEPLDSPPEGIHRDHWRAFAFDFEHGRLTFDFKTSSIRVRGITITGIRVFPAASPRVNPCGSPHPASEVEDRRTQPRTSNADLDRFVKDYIHDAGSTASQAGLLRLARKAGIHASRDRIRAAFPESRRRDRGRPKKTY
jgi:hypothetical protein